MSEPDNPRPDGVQVTAQPAADSLPDESLPEFDARAMASAAIDRLRDRARHELHELKAQYQKLDGVVLVIALVVAVVAAHWHRRAIEPERETVTLPGLTLVRPAVWELPTPLLVGAPRRLGGAPTAEPAPYHLQYSGRLAQDARMEISLSERLWQNTVVARGFARHNRWGDHVRVVRSGVRSISGQEWLRTELLVAETRPGQLPAVLHGLEYVSASPSQEVVVSMFGTRRQLVHWERVVAPSLQVTLRNAMPLVPTQPRLVQRHDQSSLKEASSATVMVVAASVRNGSLVARGAGSGVVIDTRGSILTNAHVLRDETGRLVDAFAIARVTDPSRGPDFLCTGAPARSKIVDANDVALIACDMTMDGRAWSPSSLGAWPALTRMAAPPAVGSPLWIVGFPDVGGGVTSISQGQLVGQRGTDYLRTDADISLGNSGGPVVDKHGRLVGIATAIATTGDERVMTVPARTGLVRPLAAADDLLALSVLGWLPRTGPTDVTWQPEGFVPVLEGRARSVVVVNTTQQPVEGAMVYWLRPDVTCVDVHALDTQVVAWGHTDSRGIVALTNVPDGAGQVLVIATGHRPVAVRITDSKSDGQSQAQAGQLTMTLTDWWTPPTDPSGALAREIPEL